MASKLDGFHPGQFKLLIDVPSSRQFLQPLPLSKIQGRQAIILLVIEYHVDFGIAIHSLFSAN